MAARKLRDNPEYKRHAALMASQTTNLKLWLCNLVHLWTIHQYETEIGVKFDSKTGEVLETAWVVDKGTIPYPSLSLLASHTSGEFISKELHAQLFELMDNHEVPIIIYVPRYVTIDRCHIQTGGGHNDSATYAPGIKIRLCHEVSL